MSLRLFICALIIGILTNSINSVPQYSRQYIRPVYDSTASASNWYTTNRKTGTISEKSNKDSFTFIDSSEVRGGGGGGYDSEIQPLLKPTPSPSHRTQQQQQVTFRDDDNNTNENISMPLLPSRMNRTRSRTLHTRSGKTNGGASPIVVHRDHNGVLKHVYQTQYTNNDYDIISQENRVRLPNDVEGEVTTQPRGKRESDIVFPNDTNPYPHHEPTNMKFVPKCKTDEIICDDVDNYPVDFIDNIVKEEVHRYRDFFGNDILPPPNVTTRIDPGSSPDSYLCASREELIFPKLGLTSQDKWKYIVNTSNFTQGIRVEKCINNKQPCNFANNFPNGYNPVCEQKYIMRQLVSLTDRGKTATDQFKIPSCCNCVLKVANLRSDDLSDD